MNFYDFHLGDYAKHTKHLTLMEDLAYRRMLDHYYITESPLPLEPEKIARLIGMREHIKEVSDVLSDFFLKSEKGWVNKRCEEEITTYTEKANRARKANKARWNAKLDLTADLKSDTKSDPSGSEIINDSDPPIPIPIPIKEYMSKKPSGNGRKAKTTRTQWPESFTLTAELDQYARENGIPNPEIEFENFHLKSLAHNYRYADWGKAWMAWCRSPLQQNSTSNGNGHAGKQPDGSLKVAL